MSLPVKPRLFDILEKYAKDLERGRIKPGRLAVTSPALVFCENFYAQFFQNELAHEIKALTQDAKAEAVRLRLSLKKQRAPRATIQLVTWFEKLCDIYPNVLALAYGGGTKASFVNFHSSYLITLVERAAAWSKTKGYVRIEVKAENTLKTLRRALAKVQ